MNHRLIHFLALMLLCVLAATTVSAQELDVPKPTNALASLDFEQAQAAENAGNYDDAVRLYGRVIDREPDYWPAYYKRGVIYSIHEEYALSVDDFSHLIELKPDFEVAYDARAVVYEELGEHEKAVADATTAIELGIEDNYVYFTRGSAYLGLAEYEKAIDDFTYWIDLNPKTFAVAYFYRSRAYYAVSNLHGTIADLDIFIELQPESPTVLADRAFLHRLLGNYDNAISDYSKAIDFEVEGVEDMYLERGRTYALQGDYANMLADLRAYAKLAGDHADPTVLDLLKNHPE